MMLLARVMIVITSLIWFFYGLWLFFDPRGLDYTGLAQPGWPATVEVVAQYGAFECLLGAWTALGILRERTYQRPVLMLWALLYSALVVGRIFGIIVWDGSFSVQLGDLPNSYNPGTLFVLELPSAVLFWLALWRTRNQTAQGSARQAEGAGIGQL
jgi:hypothetical protein